MNKLLAKLNRTQIAILILGLGGCALICAVQSFIDVLAGQKFKVWFLELVLWSIFYISCIATSKYSKHRFPN